MAAHLPAASLPLRFVLPLSLTGQVSSAFPSTALSPCVTTELNGFTIYRTLDPEPEASFVSLGILFLACGMTIPQGLLRFQLTLASNDLGGLAPFNDVWIELDQARMIADQLGIGDVMAGLLDERSAKAFTVLDYETNEPSLLHNWRIPPNWLSAKDYATSSMLSTTFPCLLMTSEDLQVRTQLDPVLIRPHQQSIKAAIDFHTLFSGLTVWSSLVYSRLQDMSETSPSESNAEESQDYFRSQLWTTLASLVILSNHNDETQLSGNLRDYTVSSDVVTKQDCLSGSAKGQLAIVDMLNRIALNLKKITEGSEGVLPKVTKQVDGEETKVGPPVADMLALREEMKVLVNMVEEGRRQASKHTAQIAALQLQAQNMKLEQEKAVLEHQLAAPKETKQLDWPILFACFLGMTFLLVRMGVVEIRL